MSGQTKPSLPEPAHGDLDSMLSRKFGKEVANYFSGSPLNRVSFLRGDHTFLTTALQHPTARFLAFKDLAPLTHSPSKLAYLQLNQVTPLIGPNPFAKDEKKIVEEFNSKVTIPQMVFLGLDDRKSGGGDQVEGEGLTWKDVYKGRPVWAVDVTPKGSVKTEADALVKTLEGQGMTFLEGRMLLGFPADEAAIYAQARALLDWNARNPYCGGCGQPTLSVNAGGKRICPSQDQSPVHTYLPSGEASTSGPPYQRPDCPTRHGISNLSFPRTDPTVIMAVVSSDGQKILLGRQKRWPEFWYSTLAGFCEPAESIEEAVRREVWEEAGVKLGRVVVHSTQPWPFPANLMIGAIGQAIPEGEKIDLGNDPELGHAKWFDFEEVREALIVGTSGLGEPPGPDYKEGGLRLPPETAIAHQLMNSVVNGNFAGGAARI